MNVIDAHSMNQQKIPKACSQSGQYEKWFQLTLMIHLSQLSDLETVYMFKTGQ